MIRLIWLLYVRYIKVYDYIISIHIISMQELLLSMLPGLPSAPQWAHGSWQHRSRALKRKRHDSSQFISMTYDMTFIGRKVFKKHQKTIQTLYQTLVGGELLGGLGTSIPKTPCSFLSQPPSSNFRHLLQSLKRWRKPEEMQGNTSLKSPRVSQSAPSNLKLISP